MEISADVSNHHAENQPIENLRNSRKQTRTPTHSGRHRYVIPTQFSNHSLSSSPHPLSPYQSGIFRVVPYINQLEIPS